jgi:hypothetical protein
MLRALVEFRIRGVKVRLYRKADNCVLMERFKDQHSFSFPTSHPRRVHWWQDVDNGLNFVLLD